jgi:4-diphosphocytidyl-2-C-methyl-D-erythritol kinase
MSRIVLQSPAKLNLFLKVQNKRPDGYHNIVTLFQRISLADQISFRTIPDKKIRIICDHPHVPVGSKNLVTKVAQLLQRETRVKQGIEIKIKKNIPVAAGLAGGSSNAATALLGLNETWKLGLSRPKLLHYARKIGSDVAFFLYDTSWAIGTERGDCIKKLKIETKLWQILVVPRIKMYSWEVYGGLKSQLARSNLMLERSSGLKLSRSHRKNEGGTNVLTKINDNANILTRNLKKGNVLEVGRLLVNDLESEVIRLCPRLNKLKERLKSLNTNGVMVSGSGPSVFGLTTTEKEAKNIKSILSKRFSQVFVVRTL